MPHPMLDPILATLSYELIEMLRSFRHERSFKDVAIRFGRDERTVSRQLLDIDQAFWSTQQIHILEREPGRKSYRLTTAGEIFVDALEPITSATRDAIDAATAATRRVPVLCTSECLQYFRALSEALPTYRNFDVTPLPRRTADIDLTFALPERPPGSRVCLLSALMSSEQNPTVGRVLQWNDRVEVLPLELDSLRLLAIDDLGFRRPVTVREVIEAGVTLLTPNGGVAWEFLNRSFPEWKKLRPFQHIAIPDVDYGLRCLAGRLVPKSAMVIHGLNALTYERYGLQHPWVYDFVTIGSHQLLAVTGAFHIRRESDPTDDMEPFEIIWKTARSLWSGS